MSNFTQRALQKSFRRAFYDQKENAKRRGISFEFSYDEWLRWWEISLGPKWFDLRGCRKGQYVMARNGDVGPYNVDNVKCVLNTINNSERKIPRGETHGRSKLTKEIVVYIRQSNKSYAALAKELNLNLNTVCSVGRGHRWGHLNDETPPRRIFNLVHFTLRANRTR